jgi:E3 ubiquitin-protein ligase MYCBP2
MIMVSLSKVEAFKYVCRDDNCLALCNKVCQKMHPCGHPCNGFKDEAKCMPCLHESCVKANEAQTLGTTEFSDCMICYTDPLRQAPCIQFKCKHIFHVDCITEKVRRRWEAGNNINFSFIECPACNQVLEHDQVQG